QIDLRDAGRGRKPPFIVGVVAAHGFDVVEGALLAPHDPIPSSKLYVSGIGGFCFKGRFVKPRREYLNEVNISRKFAMLFFGNAARDKNSKVPNTSVNSVDYGPHLG